MTFQDLMYRRFKSIDNNAGRVLALDPGETTGWCLFAEGVLSDWGQAATYDKVNKLVNWEELLKVLDKSQADKIICENYRVYAHKLEEHTFSEVATLRIIGGIDLYRYQHNIPIIYQMAHQAKGLCTDEKLKQWGYYKKGLRHSRDAIRHACYYLLVDSGKK